MKLKIDTHGGVSAVNGGSYGMTYGMTVVGPNCKTITVRNAAGAVPGWLFDGQVR